MPRYDIAWKYVQYGRIWDYLRSELEMDARFKTLDMKLNLVQDNLKYFLEIFQDRKARSGLQRRLLLEQGRSYPAGVRFHQGQDTPQILLCSWSGACQHTGCPVETCIRARHHGCMPRPQPPDHPPAAPVLQSTSLEWIIIILIGVEICLSLLDLYHKGMMV